MDNSVSPEVFGLPADTHEKLNAVFARHEHIGQVLIYGSRAMGSFREGSDIDLSLKGEELEYDLLSRVIREIDDLNLPYLFDISIYDHIEDSDLRGHIDRAGKVFYERLGFYPGD